MSPHEIILAPVLSEKAVVNIQDGKYAFFVHPSANRSQVKEAVQKAFGVDVLKVNIQNKEGKIKSMGRYSGRRPSRKKAIVTLKPGQRIRQLEGLT
jgi:large subunit ribosomal protein L23